jgi:hypothetical protein
MFLCKKIVSVDKALSSTATTTATAASGNDKSSDNKGSIGKGNDGICVLGWFATMNRVRVVAKDAGHHGWGGNPGWN